VFQEDRILFLSVPKVLCVGAAHIDQPVTVDKVFEHRALRRLEGIHSQGVRLYDFVWPNSIGLEFSLISVPHENPSAFLVLGSPQWELLA